MQFTYSFTLYDMGKQSNGPAAGLEAPLIEAFCKLQWVLARENIIVECCAVPFIFFAGSSVPNKDA